MGFNVNSLNSALSTVSGAFASAGRDMSQAIERISTGSRINRASDDFTGFSKLADLKQETRSFSDTGNALREHSATIQQALDVANQMMDDLTSMKTAQQNGDTDLAAGYGASVVSALSLDDSQGTDLINATLVTDLGITTADGTAMTDSITAITNLAAITASTDITDADTEMDELTTYIQELEGLKATVDSQGKLADIMASNSEAVSSAITEVDEAAEMAKYVDADIRQQAAISMVSQANMSRRNISMLYR